MNTTKQQENGKYRQSTGFLQRNTPQHTDRRWRLRRIIIRQYYMRFFKEIITCFTFNQVLGSVCQFTYSAETEQMSISPVNPTPLTPCVSEQTNERNIWICWTIHAVKASECEIHTCNMCLCESVASGTAHLLTFPLQIRTFYTRGWKCCTQVLM